MTLPFDSTIDAGGSLPELVAAGAQPGWVVLNCARDERFTGQIVFHTQPEIEVYFDFGMTYHAVSAGDLTLSEQLVAAGVVVPAQIERGTVRVGKVDHLGRLFDRDSSIERDSVMVALELATDDVIATIANHPPTSFSVTAYRHHASGVHRWFASSARPSQRGSIADLAQCASTVGTAQPDNSVTNGFADTADPLPVDEISIEWDHPIEPAGRRTMWRPVEEVLGTPQDSSEPPPAPAPGVSPVAVEPASEAVRDEPPPAAERDFQIVWPDGTAESIPQVGQVNVEGVAIETHEPIALVGDVPAAGHAAIAQALRRALEIIEYGGLASPPVVEVPLVEPLAASARSDKPADTLVAAAAFARAKPVTPASGFPAPAYETSAEMLRPGVTTLILNDDEEDSDGGRSGALRRLIESLHRN